MTAVNATAEQIEAVDRFATGSNLTVAALAGSGKTTTLRMMANATTGSGLYLAFNKTVQAEAQLSFPPHVSARTVHSLAYRHIMDGSRQQRMRLPRQTGRDVAKILGVKEKAQVGELSVNTSTLASLALATVNRFCHSDETKLDGWMVPVPDWAAAGEPVKALREAVLPLAERAWEDITAPAGKIRYTHDHYVKEWALTKPALDYNYIFLDEAQDQSPVMVGVLRHQDTQIVAVGDQYQSLYQWRGAIDAMGSFDSSSTCHLTKSFRFGPAIAAEANRWLGQLGSEHFLVGHDPIQSRIGATSSPNAVLCRTNAGAISAVMDELASGGKPALVGGATAMTRFAEAAERLKRGHRVTHPDLAPFETWEQVRRYVDQEDSGKDLAVSVKLVDTYGTAKILSALRLTVAEKVATVIASTAHVAKGREWDTVKIGDDFKAPKEGGQISSSEGMLAYVAVTRAKKFLDRGSLSFIDRFAS